jgi:phenylacetate-coenzyme A ligase PaaK-like adenylate-forming protein
VSNLNKTNHEFSVNDCFVNNIFNQQADKKLILDLVEYQYANNELYRNWCTVLNRKPDTIKTIEEIPFLPIGFFKSHKVVTGHFHHDIIFESSGTTGTSNSKHYVKDLSIYKKSFTTAFENFYGDIKEWCIIGLLPSYLERGNSSLVRMVDELIKLSENESSSFYLSNLQELQRVLGGLELKKQKTLLIGVTFALLDFAESFPMQLKFTTVLETGGMKGRRKELTRKEVHTVLKERLGVENIDSEYGMTELLSQAYSKGEGRFFCPPWMRVLVRDEEDPLTVKTHGRGVLNIIDMANIFSCSFIATDDVGIVDEAGSFEVWGRLDNSDIRGCSLLIV